jgi:hypothetical protein
LDDLIVGAWGVDLVDKIAVGKSYVVFGKIDNTAINLSAIYYLDWLPKHQQSNHPSHLRSHRLHWKLSYHCYHPQW